MRARPLAVVVVVVAAIVMAGCTPDDPEPAPTGPPYEFGCSVDYPDRLELTAVDADLVDATVMCANADLSAATIENRTDVVLSFVFDAGTMAVTPYASDLFAGVFREGADTAGISGTVFAAPGDTMWVGAGRASGVVDIAWSGSPRLTSVWLVQQTIVERANDVTVGAAVEALASSDAARRAVSTCAFSGGFTSAAMRELGEGSPDFVETFAVAAGAAPCARDWSAAEIEFGSLQWPTLGESVGAIAPNGEPTAELAERIAAASRQVAVAVAVVR